MASQDGQSSDLEQGGRHPRMVIVSEQGRHSEESRRIVRAQAARASAAASRVTRARNRGEREETIREPLQPPPANDASPREATQVPPRAAPTQAPSSSTSLPRPGLETIHGQMPLANWLPSVLDGSYAMELEPT